MKISEAAKVTKLENKVNATETQLSQIIAKSGNSRFVFLRLSSLVLSVVLLCLNDFVNC
jgi:hypothetical protein